MHYTRAKSCPLPDASSTNNSLRSESASQRPVVFILPLPSNINQEIHKLDFQLNTIGRSRKSTIILLSPNISRLAADIIVDRVDQIQPGSRRTQRGLVKIMTRSNKGILVNDVPVRAAGPNKPFSCGFLFTGDVVKLGKRHKYRILISGSGTRLSSNGFTTFSDLDLYNRAIELKSPVPDSNILNVLGGYSPSI